MYINKEASIGSIGAKIGQKMMGIGSSLAKKNLSTAKAIGVSSAIGGALGGMKSQASAENNPNMTAGDKATNIMGGVAAGALGGAVAGGIGKSLINKGINTSGNLINKGGNFISNFGKTASEELDDLYQLCKIAMNKKSEMECPTEEEKQNRLNSSEEEVRESPNSTEKKRMIETSKDDSSELKKDKEDIE